MFNGLSHKYMNDSWKREVDRIDERGYRMRHKEVWG